MDIVEQTDHRPWPLPPRPWRIAMTWRDLLFAHWPVPVAALRPHVPEALEIETFDGTAWIGVVPFYMTGVRAHWAPPLPGANAFPELNTRTYVSAKGKSGVWFFSLDAGHRLAVEVARRTFHLPYFQAKMRAEKDVEGCVRYESRRTDRRAGDAELDCRYRPTSRVTHAAPGSIEHFLTERYCLYAFDRQGTGYRGEVHHLPWPLQPAEAEFDADTMTNWLGVTRPQTPPLLHYARELEVVAWPLSRV